MKNRICLFHSSKFFAELGLNYTGCNYRVKKGKENMYIQFSHNACPTYSYFRQFDIRVLGFISHSLFLNQQISRETKQSRFMYLFNVFFSPLESVLDTLKGSLGFERSSKCLVYILRRHATCEEYCFSLSF